MIASMLVTRASDRSSVGRTGESETRQLAKFWCQTRRWSSVAAVRAAPVCVPSARAGLRPRHRRRCVRGSDLRRAVASARASAKRSGPTRFARTVGGGAIITAVAAARSGLRCRVVSALSAVGGRVAHAGRGRGHRSPAPARAAGASPRRCRRRTNRTFVTFTGVNDRLEARLFAPLRRVAARHVHFAFCPARCLRWRPVLARAAPAPHHHLVGFRLERTAAARSRIHAARRRRSTISAERAGGDALRRRAAAVLGAGLLEDEAPPGRSSSSAPRGSRWLSPDQDIEVPPPAVKVVDTTGAGDAFNGGFLAARAARRTDRRERLRAGNRLGALSTRKAGGIDGLPADERRR